MNERYSRLKHFLPRAEVALGTLGTGATVLTDMNPSQAIQASEWSPFGMARLLQITTEVGIPVPVALSALTIAFVAVMFDGARRINREKR